LYGAGIQNKILEAMATGTPVVTTFSALSALQVKAGEELLAVHSSEEFASAVLQLMDDRNLQIRMGETGTAYVRAHHNWVAIASQLSDIYQHITHPNTGVI